MLGAIAAAHRSPSRRRNVIVGALLAVVVMILFANASLGASRGYAVVRFHEGIEAESRELPDGSPATRVQRGAVLREVRID